MTTSPHPQAKAPAAEGVSPEKAKITREQTERIQRLMTSLAHREPFFGHLILSQQMRPVTTAKECPTMGVDGLRLFFNPSWTAKQSDENLTGILVHEALHIAYMHPLRRGDRDPALYNIACDAVINRVLQKRRYAIPVGLNEGINIPVADHETSEEVYERLEQMKNQGGGGNMKMPSCGMVFDLEPGQGEDGEAQSQADADADSQKKVIEAAQKAREAGKMPGDLELIIKAWFEGKRDWRDALRRFLGGGHERQRSWTRPSRRHTDVILPGMANYGPGEIAVFIDTSGSIDDALANKFVNEVARLNDDLTPDKVHVLCIDTMVQWSRSYSGYERIEDVKFRGRGGTDFKPGFRWLEERGITPKAIIYFTDLHCHSFPQDPGVPTLWIVWPGGANHVPFGEILRM